MTKIEDEVVRLGTLNSNTRAEQYWSSEGVGSVKALGKAFDSAISKLDKAPTVDEAAKARLALMQAKLEWQAAATTFNHALQSSSMDSLSAAVTEMKRQLELAADATQAAAGAVAALGDAESGLIAASEKAVKAYAQAAEIVSEGGNIRAGALSAGDGRVAEQASEAAIDGYVDYLRKTMAEVAAASNEQANQAQTLLIGAVAASLLIAVGSALWIALNISRGLGRAVGLAEAVAIGDLNQKIDVASDDEVGDLVKSLNTMTANLNATAKVAETIAAGDLGVDAKRLSDKDVLGIAFERMTESLRATAKVAETISTGDLSVEVKPRSDRDTLGVAFARMTESSACDGESRRHDRLRRPHDRRQAPQ